MANNWTVMGVVKMLIIGGFVLLIIVIADIMLGSHSFNIAMLLMILPAVILIAAGFLSFFKKNSGISLKLWLCLLSMILLFGIPVIFQINPDAGQTIEKSLGEINTSISIGKIDDAFSMAKLTADNYPADFRSYKALGDACKAGGNMTYSIYYYKEAMKLEPKSTAVRIKLAETYLNSGFLVEAKQQIAFARDTFPGSKEASRLDELEIELGAKVRDYLKSVSKNISKLKNPIATWEYSEVLQ